MFPCLIELILLFDIFKSPVVIRFNKKKQIPSLFSCLISISIISFLLVFFFKSDFFYRRTPMPNTQTISTNKRPRLDFDFDSMAFAFIVSDQDNRYYYDPTIYTFEMEYQYYNNTVAVLLESEKKQLAYCKKQNFQSYGSSYDDLEMKHVICPLTGNFTLEGFWDETIVKTVTVRLLPCKNLTSNVICQSSENISQFFNGKYLNAYYTNNIIDIDNYLNPIVKIYQSEYFSIDTQFSKTMRLTFKMAEFSSDESYIFPSENKITSFLFESKEVDFVPNNNRWIASINLFPSSQIYRVSRRYQKFQEAIANLGGLANSLIFLGFFLTSLEKEFIIFTIIMRKLYNLVESSNSRHNSKNNININKNNKDESPHNTNTEPPKSTNTEEPFKKENPRLMKFKSVIISQKELKDDGFILEHFSQKSILRSPRSSPNRFQRNKMKTLIRINEKNKIKEEMKLTFWEFLKIKMGMPCLKYSKKQKIFMKAYDRYPKEIDLIQIVQKIHEIDKLKTVLLNPEQCQLLNLLAKPSLQSTEDDGILSEDIRSSKNKLSLCGGTSLAFNKLQVYYKKILKEGANASDIDKKLLKLLDEKII